MHPPASAKLENNVVLPATKPYSVASVTVAYNGASVLREHLDSLKRQSRKLEEIIVVDNASSDDTLRLLAREYTNVTVLPLPENGGIAGGLAAGLAYAMAERKHDWVWTFDQDSLPSVNALERLLAGFQSLGESQENIAILAPVCVNQATGTKYPALLWKGDRFLPASYSQKQLLTFVDMVISSGSLMRSSALAEAGFPRRDFFMDFVDYEHCLRLRRHGFRIVVVHDSLLDHAIGTPTTFHIFGRRKSWPEHTPLREYYMTRNEIFTIWAYRPTLLAKSFIFCRLARHALGILLFGKRRLECLRMMWRGIVDARARRLGRREDLMTDFVSVASVKEKAV